jgi:peptidyl-prolyl cis-trans isomerase A (cyclophilin A)
MLVKTVNLNVAGARRARLAAAAALGLFLYGCGSPAPEKGPPTAAKKKSGRAPDVFRVRFDTSKGPFTVEVHRDWAPRGADHFYDLVETGYYNGNRFFRVVRNFVVQFGINGDPGTSRLWSQANIPDDPVRQSNRKGTITYAMRGPATRATQVFINLKNNAMLDKDGFVPFGAVVEGMDVVENLYKFYGDMPPRGEGPDPMKIEQEGNTYLERRFPRLDFVRKAAVAPAP